MSSERLPTTISFEPRHVLRSNGLILEADDFTPESLADFVTIHADPITDQIENIHRSSRRHAHDPHLVQKETILIARLALRGSEHVALSWDAYQHQKRFYDHPTDLNATYEPYWRSLFNTAFIPRIRNRSANNATQTTGIWLGVTLP